MLNDLTSVLTPIPKTATLVAAIRHRATELCSQPGASERSRLPRSDHVHSDRAAAPRHTTYLEGSGIHVQRATGDTLVGVLQEFLQIACLRPQLFVETALEEYDFKYLKPSNDIKTG